jgi:adenylate cyclase
MGGTIAVESEPDRGTSFTVQLPAAGDKPVEVAPIVVAASRPPRAQAAPQRSNRVLVIDDDPTVRDLMRRFLSREGFDAVTAEDGREGIDLARELRPSVITLDVFMPEMDGWSVLQALKADPDLATIPVIMLTILDEKQKGVALGASGYLTKPVDRARLAALLDRFKVKEAVPRVLVVEDDAVTREMMRRLLVAEGWEVTGAGNGREALDRLATDRPHLILLDQMMPEMDGFQFLAELRNHTEAAATPVIIVTAADLSAEDRRSLSGGVEHILQKGGVDRDELMQQIRRLVGRYAAAATLTTTGS